MVVFYFTKINQGVAGTQPVYLSDVVQLAGSSSFTSHGVKRSFCQPQRGSVRTEAGREWALPGPA